MEIFEAKILLKNLLKRIRKIDEDTYELAGTLTDDELTALKMAQSRLNGDEQPAETSQAASSVQAPVATFAAGTEANVAATPTVKLKPLPDYNPLPETLQVPANQPDAGVPENIGTPGADVQETVVLREIELDTSALELSAPPEDYRLCFDFGTAMSKVTFVKDATDDRPYEEIEVLQLGFPGDQEEISENMLVSSVFIDGDGLIWFGQMAVVRSGFEAQGGFRQRLDNIKRYLSEEGLNNKVLPKFNPTEIEITYADLVLAYLMFLTWAVNQCLEESEQPRNLNRRFAMPCFEGGKSRDTSQILRTMLGEAQVLADTFYQTLTEGISLSEFTRTVAELRKVKRDYSFVREDITEPLGVAGSIMSWERNVNALVMVVDVGAGTSDFSLYRMHYDPSIGKSVALEVKNSSEGITEAGNHLDGLLRGMILKSAGIDSNHEHWVNILGNLELDLRNYKERLFEDGEVTVKLFNDQIVPIELAKFLELDQVKRFGQSLVDCRNRILTRVDPSFIKAAPNHALGVALTGGGATLPMVKALAAGTVRVHEEDLRLVQTKAFPEWLQDDYPELEDEYPRIAVSLGGARKRIIDRGGVASITAGDVKVTPTLGGYFTKGN